MNFDPFIVVFARENAPALNDEWGRDLHENVLIHAMRGHETILVLVSRTGLADYFGMHGRTPLAQWNSVVDRHIDTFNRIAQTKLKGGQTLMLTNPFGRTFTGIFIAEDDIKQSGETLTADVLKIADAAEFSGAQR